MIKQIRLRTNSDCVLSGRIRSREGVVSMPASALMQVRSSVGTLQLTADIDLDLTDGWVTATIYAADIAALDDPPPTCKYDFVVTTVDGRTRVMFEGDVIFVEGVSHA